MLSTCPPTVKRSTCWHILCQLTHSLVVFPSWFSLPSTTSSQPSHLIRHVFPTLFCFRCQCTMLYPPDHLTNCHSPPNLHSRPHPHPHLHLPCSHPHPHSQPRSLISFISHPLSAFSPHLAFFLFSHHRFYLFSSLAKGPRRHLFFCSILVSRAHSACFCFLLLLWAEFPFILPRNCRWTFNAFIQSHAYFDFIASLS